MAEIRINATGELKLYDSDDSNYVSFKSAGTVSSNVAWVLPSADGSSGQALTTNGSGTLSWATAGSADPSSADGDSLGTASAEWSDLYLADAGVIYFGNDQDITLTHVPDTGLILGGTTPTLTIGDAGAEDTRIIFDGNAVDYRLGIDDSADTFEIGIGSTHATTPQATFSSTGVVFNEAAGDYDFRIETSGNSYTHMVFVESGAGEFNINDSAGEGTITFNSAAEDGIHLGIKNSDVAHGVTGMVETDTFFTIQKQDNADGGALIRGYTEGAIGAQHWSVATTVNTTVSTSGRAGFEFCAAKKSGDGKTSSDGHLFAVRNNNSTRFIITEGGDIHSDSGNGTTYDEYDDAHLVRAFDLSKGEKSKGLINSQFDKYIKYNHETLADAGLVGKEDDGTPNHFINITGMQRLHNGAIWQQYEKHERLLEAVYDLAKEAVGEDKANAILDKHEVKRLQ